MAYYLVESYHFVVDHQSPSEGVLADHVSRGSGAPKSSEKIYLHVIEIQDKDIAKLSARVDEDGNKQHDRLALPRNEDWWVAVDGEFAWPKVFGPRVFSRCVDVETAPKPAPLGEADIERLRKSGVGQIPSPR
jgi:hypothetical protein